MNNFDQPYTFDLKGQCALLCRRDHLRLGGFVATKLATKIFGANMAQRRSVLSSRTSRAALSYSDAPEWEIINPICGWATGAAAGAMAVVVLGWQHRCSSDGTRVKIKLGRADDLIPAVVQPSFRMSRQRTRLAGGSNR
ncbi:hypothetical protein [Mesorhizobium sp. M0698]|uniref:hypothetical protein n=1 Tax=Mesorhizobium sp. M0698 TaxID=2956987 RepID=UPI0033365785